VCLCSSEFTAKLYHRLFRARGRGDGIPPYERRKRVELSCLTVTSDERARVEAREDCVAVYCAEWVIQDCEDQIGRVYDEQDDGEEGEERCGETSVDREENQSENHSIRVCMKPCSGHGKKRT